jgi:hypothetical protein
LICLDDYHPDSPLVDIGVFNAKTEEPVVAIEVVQPDGLDKSVLKCRQILADYPSMKEAFVVVYQPSGSFEYTLHGWYRVTPESEIAEETSFSIVFGLEMQLAD